MVIFLLVVAAINLIGAALLAYEQAAERKRHLAYLRFARILNRAMQRY